MERFARCGPDIYTTDGPTDSVTYVATIESELGKDYVYIGRYIDLERQATRRVCPSMSVRLCVLPPE